MLNLDDIRVIKRYDQSGMLRHLESFPEQCRAAKTIGQKFDLPRSLKRRYANIVCTGLGGSAIGADLLRAYISGESKAPILVNRNYALPSCVGRDSLVVAISYSGDTEETISAYRDAGSKKANIIAVTSGGMLSKLASRDGHPVVTVPGGLPPRCALGYSFFPMLVLFSKMGIVRDRSKEMNEAMDLLEFLKEKKAGQAVAASGNPAKFIARTLWQKFPVIYASTDHLDSVVTRWRGQLAENSKVLSSTHLFPEMNHNEIVGWENPAFIKKKFITVILRDSLDHARNSRRIDVTKEILNKAGVRSVEVKSVGEGLLARIFSLVYLGDFVSYYLAILNGEDPTPVDRIAYLKSALSAKAKR